MSLKTDEQEDNNPFNVPSAHISHRHALSLQKYQTPTAPSLIPKLDPWNNHRPILDCLHIQTLSLHNEVHRHAQGPGARTRWRCRKSVRVLRIIRAEDSVVSSPHESLQLSELPIYVTLEDFKHVFFCVGGGAG